MSASKPDNEWAKKVGAGDAESLKAEYVGDDVSKFNILRNKENGRIILKAIKGGIEIITDYILKE